MKSTVVHRGNFPMELSSTGVKTLICRMCVSLPFWWLARTAIWIMKVLIGSFVRLRERKTKQRKKEMKQEFCHWLLFCPQLTTRTHKFTLHKFTQLPMTNQVGEKYWSDISIISLMITVNPNRQNLTRTWEKIVKNTKGKSKVPYRLNYM